MCNKGWLIKNGTLKGTGIIKYAPLPRHTRTQRRSSRMVCDQRLEDRLEFGLGLLLAGGDRVGRREEWKSRWGMKIKKVGESRRESNGGRRAEKWARRGRMGMCGGALKTGGQHGMLPYNMIIQYRM
jgi:hypothetical protein